MDLEYDVAVVGGGHAGYEAAHASARMGCKTILLTMDVTRIGTLSCNPAIGGTAKGHLVKEIDALGGLMGYITDNVGIQFRLLNRSRGPAVWSPRAQVERSGYPLFTQLLLQSTQNLSVAEANVVDVRLQSGGIRGLVLESGDEIRCAAAVLTCGTFLNGVIHVGLHSEKAGRFGEKPASGITEALVALGLESGRLKTGTPPRIRRDTIDFSKCLRQDGDEKPEPFSARTRRLERRQVPCHLTHTSPETHEILKTGFDRSPMYTGRIKGTGPRYCPSIEDKISRFSDKDHHQIFLEPEGYDSIEYYVNGFSTSLPEDVQKQAIRTIPGLENVEILRPGYAVEYDFFPPYQIKLNMESKSIPGLFLAGQINGTSGYEEAGAQGLMAGINAALSVKTGGSFVLRRNEAYIGVLIDDLVNKSTLEPYRIFTSLAEYRLLLRYDNADLRLTERARALGLVSDEQFALLMRKVESMNTVRRWLATHHARPAEINDFLRRHGSSDLAEPEAFEKLIKRPEVSLEHVRLDLPNLLDEGIIECLDFGDVQREVNTTIKYEGYIQRQLEQVARFERLEAKHIPPAFPYGQIKSLSKEAREKLARVRPESVGQASRISGITPADISLLLVYLEKGEVAYSQEPA